jgi:serine/threonine-protein kinase
MKELLGKTPDKTYRIDELLGEGGMGAVYRAHDLRLNRDVAVKVMHPRFADDSEFRARFLQKARAIATLNHLSIAHVQTFQETFMPPKSRGHRRCSLV